VVGRLLFYALRAANAATHNPRTSTIMVIVDARRFAIAASSRVVVAQYR